jgi:farnesyl-diphosphate farnesyltransferase
MTVVGDLLHKTSRTFALAIPMLPGPVRQEVSVAYLLFRVIDTFEDATHWPPAQRIQMLGELSQLLDARPDEPDGQARAHGLAERCRQDPPLDHAGYRDLLAEIPLVLRELGALAPASGALVREHVKRSAHAMAEVVSRIGTDGLLALQSLGDLRNYCYAVAGIVGEMLAELFVLADARVRDVAGFLRERSYLFGEGLQLVNILKDADADAREGRTYLPPAVGRAEVFALARADLRAATDFTLALQNQGAERGLVAFNALLVRLALGTLGAIRAGRPGGKLSRMEVFALMAAVHRDLDAGQPVLPGDGLAVEASAAV